MQNVFLHAKISLFSRLSCFLLLITPFSALPPLGADLASAPVNQSLNRLASFAELIASSSATILATGHDLEASRNSAMQQKMGFRPLLRVDEGSSKSSNRNYNTLTGIDEDYTTKRKGSTVSLQQRTPIGTARLDFERSRTEYTTAQASFFSSAYMTLETGLLRRDSRMLTLEKQISRSGWLTEKERFDSVLLDTLMSGCNMLLDRLLAEQNLLFRERNLIFYQKMLEEANVKLENGLGSELDRKQAEMRLTMAETDLEQSRLSLEEADRQIGVLLASSTWNHDLASFTPGELAAAVPPEFSPEALTDVALKKRPDIRMIRVQLETQKKSVSLAREKAKPNVSSSLRWGRQGRATDQEMARDMRDKSWDVLIGYETTLGPRPEKLEKRAEQERLNALEDRFGLSCDAARKAVIDKADRLKFQLKNLADLKQSKALSAEILEGQRLNFQLGKVSLLDLLKYQSDFEASCLAEIQGETALVRYWLQLQYEIGQLTEYLRVSSSSAGKKFTH